MEIEDQLISLQLAVDKICSVIAEKTDVTFSNEFIEKLTALTFRNVGDISQKLAYFAKHAKRSEITKDDVKLYFRCSQQMLAVIEESSDISCGSDTKSTEYVVGKTFCSHNYLSLNWDSEDVSTDTNKEQRSKKNNEKKIKKSYTQKKVKKNHSIENALEEKERNIDPIEPQTSQRKSRRLKKKNIKKKNDITEYRDEIINPEDQQVQRNDHKQNVNKENGNIVDEKLLMIPVVPVIKLNKLTEFPEVLVTTKNAVKSKGKPKTRKSARLEMKKNV